MRIILAMEGEKINWCYDTKDFVTFPENRRIKLSVRFLERLAEKIRAFGILLMILLIIIFRRCMGKQ
jgi:hypothetical protein